MKKKSGFTLLELLAVIIILAVIALIITPVILNVIETSKKEAFRETTRNLYHAADTREATKTLTTEISYCSVYNFSNDQESGFLSEEELDKIFGKDNYSKLQSYKYDRIEKLNVKGKLPTEGILCSCNSKWLGKVGDGNYTAIPDGSNIIVEKGDDLSSVDQTKAVINNITTETTSTSIKVVVDAEVGNYGKIKSYEYNIDGGEYKKGTGNTYTFDNLGFHTEHTIGIKITTNSGLVTEGSTKATTEYALLSVTANGYTGTYDGSSHGITVTSSGATIKYGTSEGNYNLTSSPTYTNAGTYTVYYQVTKEGYQPVEGSKQVVITKANGSVTLSKTSESLTYPTSKTITITENTSNGTLSCTSSDTNIATCSISGTTMTVTPGTTAGVAAITVTSGATTNYNVASATYSATVASGLLSVSASGYSRAYDGKAHGITVTCSGATIKYGTSKGTYNLNSSPTYTNVGTYIVYYEVSKEGYQTVTSNRLVTIIKAEGEVTLAETSGSVSYPNTTTVDVTKNKSGGSLSCASSNTNIATCSVSGNTITITPKITSGNATITVTSGVTTNYNEASAQYELTTESGVLSVTANGYTGTYDGNAHGITVTSSGATIKYGTSAGTYNLSSSPTYTNAGTYTIYYQVTKAGYQTVTGSRKVTITKANGSLTLSETSGTVTYPNTKTFSVTKNTSNGSLSCSTSNTNIATCSISGTTVTVTPKITSGNATITVTSGATTNYNEASTQYELTTKSGVLSVTANGYTGTYDGNAHGITVTSSGATIKYGTSSGTYNLNSSPTYTNAGTYTVYYQVTKAGYQTVTGNKTITIRKASGDFTLSKTSGSITYPGSTTVEVTENKSGGSLSCASSNNDIATCSVSGNTVTITAGTTPGVAVITIISGATTNYYSESKSYTSTTASGLLSVTANGYTGAYDGSSHGITVTSSGATIKYGTSAGTYNLNSSPTYTNAGTYTVYYQITRAGYKTVTGSKQVVITKANGSLTLSKSSGSITYPGSATISVSGNTSGGSLSCSTSNTNIATCSVSGTTVIVSSGTTAGVATITVTSAATINYNAISKTYTSTTVSGTLSITANGYDGPYDGKAHGITVASSGATIKYGTSAGTYNLSSSPTYTEAGTYTVYYQVTRSGYKTVTGSKQVIIKHMVYAAVYSDGTLAFNSTGKVDSSKTLTMDVTDITEKNFSYNNHSPWYDHRDSIAKVVFEDQVVPKSTAYWFFYLTSLLTIQNIQNLDTSKVTNMNSMFYECKSLTSLDVSHFDTSNIKNMSQMFYHCSSLTSLNINNFDTRNVTNMSYMFGQCNGLTSLDVSNFNTRNVTDMNGMFAACTSLTSLDVSHFDTSNVTDMSSMFAICSDLMSLDVSHFDTSNVINMADMFATCSNLISLDVNNFDTSKVIDMSSMFSSCGSLSSLDLSHFDTSNVTNMDAMFIYCFDLANLNISHFDTSKVTDMGYMFRCCNKLTSLNISNFNTSNVTDMTRMFEDCRNLTNLTLGRFDISMVTSYERMFNSASKLTTVKTTNSTTKTWIEARLSEYSINATVTLGS